MTDSVTLRIPLTPVAAASCKATGYGSIKKRKEGQRIEYLREKVVNSPLSRARMTVLFMQADDNPNSLPIAVSANLNLPSALFSQNYILGCSTFAAASAGVKLLKIVLAQEGVPAEELEKISIADPTLDSVTLTFLYETASSEKADLQMAMFTKSLKAMSLTKLRGLFSTNQTLYVTASEFSITLYNKTNEDSIAWQEGAPKDLIRKRGKRLIRLEVVLPRRFLKARGLHLPEAWRRAASNAIQEAHVSRGHPNPVATAKVQDTMRGIRRTMGAAPVHATALPRRHILQLAAQHRGPGLHALRNRAMLLLGFAGAFRRSELVGLTVADVTVLADGLRIPVKRSKTDQEGRGRTVWISRAKARASCAVESLRRWLVAARITQGPLFRKGDAQRACRQRCALAADPESDRQGGRAQALGGRRRLSGIWPFASGGVLHRSSQSRHSAASDSAADRARIA